jgi:diguanylate cyclase (GGDEF)-like protein
MDRLTGAVLGGRQVSLAIIDLDHFKQVNDTYGHTGGDAVLVQVAQLLAGAVRQDDVVARYGGEEFVVLFHGAGAEAAWSRIDALRLRLGDTPIAMPGRTVTVTFSAGVAELGSDGDIEALLRAADDALYEAKRRGRDRVELAGVTSVAQQPDG